MSRRVIETAVEQRVLVVSSWECDIRTDNLVSFTIGVCLVNSEGVFLTTELCVLYKFYQFIKLSD